MLAFITETKNQMAKFINTRKAVAAIEDLIKEAEDKLVLVSPYLKLSKDFKELLTYRNSKDKITTIIFGKQELNPNEMKFLEGLRFVILKYNQDLHAKCYMNDKQMIITSLNLYEFSMANNKEMGVLIELSDENDRTLFEDALKEIEYIDSTSERFEFNTATKEDKAEKQPKNQKTSSQEHSNNGDGHCIRCNKSIKLNPLVPYCKDCYKIWNKYKDEEYAEVHCHICGKEQETTFLKPTCYPCFKANKNKLEFNL
ncbi:phospholipase D family protein [Reichenbachiella sp. MALMAid0571]|uniref:phospholipase D family protein n=1 Tax=Reichenbachiella sp. MALMAid0571 TaxID=3143939 RepID=UPI0032DE8DC4